MRTYLQHARRHLPGGTDPIPALDTFVLTGDFILMNATITALAANTTSTASFTQVEAAGTPRGVSAHIASPYAVDPYLWDTGIDDRIVTVTLPGSYVVGWQAWFGNGSTTPGGSFTGIVGQGVPGHGAGVYATPQPGGPGQAHYFDGAFDLTNTGIDYTKHFVWDAAVILTGLDLCISVSHNNAGALDVGVSLFIVRMTT